MPATSEASTDRATVESADTSKAKRVRTGCRTCRDRHLKCDEGLPQCHNCSKSSRLCVYGVKLNFIVTKCRRPPTLASQGRALNITFHDDSREIASEYSGGLKRYSRPELEHQKPMHVVGLDFAPSSSLPEITSNGLPPHHNIPLSSPSDNEQLHNSLAIGQSSRHHLDSSNTDEGYSSSLPPASLSPFMSETVKSPSIGSFLGCLTDPNELLYMKAFIDEVGLWMDSLNEEKHFSRLLPFKAMQIPMLKDAFLACGARHLSLVNPSHSEESALHYYDTATRHLLHALEDPNRDTSTCATTAVILNVYEIMCERALQRMNHIAGARALIKECGWNARSTGVGAACFWLNVGMELLSCLHFNWQVAWDPDEWGLESGMQPETEDHREDTWTYRMMHLVAKIANFRASASVIHDSSNQGSPRTEQTRRQQRYLQWQQLLEAARRWHECIPATMHPLGILEPHSTQSNSTFPEVYLGGKRTSTVAQLFYHTAMVLLAQINPFHTSQLEDMRRMQMVHSTLICGIVAHTKDRGVASVAIRSLAIAAECLNKRDEQEEVLRIFENIRKETGWRVGFVHTELPIKWGWPEVTFSTSSSGGHIVKNDTDASSIPAQTVHSAGFEETPGLQQPLHAAAQQAHRFAQLHSSTPMPTPPSKQAFKEMLETNHQHSLPMDGQDLQEPQCLPGAQSQAPLTHLYSQIPLLNRNGNSSSLFMSIPPPQERAPQQQQQQQQTRPRMPVGIPNPLLVGADFGLSTHPYKNHYVAPTF